MSICPLCQDELDDGYCFTCEKDIFDEPEWFFDQLLLEIRDLKEIKNMMVKKQCLSLTHQEILMVALEDIRTKQHCDIKWCKDRADLALRRINEDYQP